MEINPGPYGDTPTTLTVSEWARLGDIADQLASTDPALPRGLAKLESKMERRKSQRLRRMFRNLGEALAYGWHHDRGGFICWLVIMGCLLTAVTMATLALTGVLS